MLRYLNVIILAGGKSSRFGLCKAYLYFSNLMNITKNINLFLDIGFFFILINGFYKKFTCESDIIPFYGPYSGFHTYCKTNNAIFTIFIAIDMPYVDKSIILILILNKNYICCINFRLCFFPILITNNFIFKYLILKFVFGNNFKLLSVNMILKFLPQKNLISFFKKNQFLNINTFLDLFISK